MTDPDPNAAHVIRKEATTEMLRIVVPGARAYGEEWRLQSVGHRDGKLVTEDLGETEAPEDNRSIVAMAGENGGEAAWFTDVLEAQRGKAAERKMARWAELNSEERRDLLNEMFGNWMEQKARWGRGQSQIGATGHLTQRERIVHSGRNGYMGRRL